MSEMKTYLDGRHGILVFRNSGAGHHTALWDKTHIMQDGKAISGGGAVMNETNIFGQSRALFWEVTTTAPSEQTLPDWLPGWWHVDDGNTYYYYFSDQGVVTYTKVKPKDLAAMPAKMPLNEGGSSFRITRQRSPSTGIQPTAARPSNASRAAPLRARIGCMASPTAMPTWQPPRCSHRNVVGAGADADYARLITLRPGDPTVPPASRSYRRRTELCQHSAQLRQLRRFAEHTIHLRQCLAVELQMLAPPREQDHRGCG